MNAVVIDLAFDQRTAHYAVVWQGQLLPVRFTKQREASDHLESLRRGYQPPLEEQRGAA